MQLVIYIYIYIFHHFYLDQVFWPFFKQNILNHLHPKITMHILHTVLYTFLKGLEKEFVLKFESF